MQIALVTGATRGLGTEIVKQLSQLDILVLLTGRSYHKCKEVAGLLKNNNIIPFQLDVASEKSINNIFIYIKNKYKRLDILINNAGVYLDDPRKKAYNSVTDIDTQLLREIFMVNTEGPMRLLWKFIPMMKQNKYGRIVNVSSGMASFNDFNTDGPFYRISKLSLNALTRIIALETKNDDITINSVCPGWIQTAMGGNNAPRTVQQGARKIIELSLPQNRVSGEFFMDNYILLS